jgi:hypothetical protein
VVDRSDDASTTTTAADSSTSSTLHHLEGRPYARGSCVIWNERARERADAPVKSVPCDQPHFLEMTGSVDLPGEMNFPTDEPTWDAIQQERCTPLTTGYLGYPLVSSGRFYTSSIRPVEEGWRTGDRTVHCGIAAWPDDPLLATAEADPTGEQNWPFAGAVKGQSQERVPPAGTCYADLPGEDMVVTACAGEHAFEVTGHLGLADRLDHPPTERDMNGKLGDECRGVAARYLGRPLARGEESSWLPITQEEWDNGWRTLPCLVGRWHNNKPVSVTGPMAAA